MNLVTAEIINGLGENGLKPLTMATVGSEIFKVSKDVAFLLHLRDFFYKNDFKGGFKHGLD